MTDFPGQSPLAPPPLFLNTFCDAAAGVDAAGISGGSGGAAQTWVANLAIYVPIVVAMPYPVRRVYWVNGSTITASNGDFGIYAADGTRIYSTGSTALVGTNAPQYTTPATDFVLAPGRYYFAYACDGTTSRVFGTANAATGLRQAGVLQQATALPLPASMTPAAVANALYPLCGVTRTDSGF